MEDINNFNRALFRGATTETVSVLMRNGSGVRRQYVKAGTYPVEIAGIIAANPNDNIFVGLGLLSNEPANGRGTSEDVATTVGLYIDLDMPRSEGSRYDDRAERTVSLNEILGAFTEIGLAPTAVTSTGNGSHVYFLLNKPFPIASDEDRQRVAEAFRGVSQYVKEKVAAKGWETDITADLARLDRAVGSNNVKDFANPKPVTVDFLDDTQRYDLDYLTSLAPRLPVAVTAPRRASIPSVEGTDKNLADFDAILASCAFMRHCVAHPAQLSEPEWRALLGTLAFCVDGRRMAHVYSEGHPTYSADETDRMFSRVSEEAGPPTYDHIRSILTSFTPDESFALYGTVVAPISLGYMEPDVARLVGRYAYVVAEDRFVAFDTFETRSTKAFDAENLHFKGLTAPSRDFLKSPRAIKAARRDYLPGRDRLVTSDDSGLVLNSYRQSGIAPKAGAWPYIQHHFETVFPEEQDRSAILDRFAMAIQQPGQKIKSAVMIFGPEGGGKGTILELLIKAIGRENAVTLPSAAIADAFQDDRVNKQVVIFNEVSGVGKSEVNSLKELITEEFIMVQGKGIPRYRGRTPSQVWVTTNDDAAMQINTGDRRWLVLQTPDVPPTSDYFDALYAAIPEELPAFVHAMATRDISGFNPHARPQVTTAKEHMIRSAASPLEYAIREAMEAEVGVFASDFGTAEEVIRAVMINGWSGRSPHSRSVGSILSNMGMATMGRFTLPNGTKPYFHAWRNKDQWLRADRAAVLAHRSYPTTSAEIIQLHPATSGILQDADQAIVQSRTAILQD
ncbi:DUF5906 domain-containing protein [Brevundimonas sp.]|uniref:primase-helicase family protein n=1 Tax=Brevundimonas sp. TaxID=1871086 RepID=UPI0028AC3A4E|nr:DUF5906 domain-containing protein [Brevundimonas sp.]